MKNEEVVARRDIPKKLYGKRDKENRILREYV
jgi:hypothetical protein